MPSSFQVTMTEYTHPDTTVDSILDDYEINKYEVPVQLELDEFESYEALRITITQTVAHSIVNEVEAFDDDDVSYLATQVEFNQDVVKTRLKDDETTNITVETETQIGVLDD